MSVKPGHCEKMTYKSCQSSKTTALELWLGKNIRNRIWKMAVIWKKLDLKTDIIILIRSKKLNWFGPLIRRREQNFVYRFYKNNIPDKKKKKIADHRRGKKTKSEWDTGMPLLTLKKQEQVVWTINVQGSLWNYMTMETFHITIFKSEMICFKNTATCMNNIPVNKKI